MVEVKVEINKLDDEETKKNTELYDYYDPEARKLNTPEDHDDKSTKITDDQSTQITTHPSDVPLAMQNKLKNEDTQNSNKKAGIVTSVAIENDKLSLKEKLKAKEIPGGLTINAFILLLVGSQSIWSLALIVILEFTSPLGIDFLLDDIREF